MVVTDPDAAVVANCLISLREIDGSKSLATKQIVYSLLNRLKDFSEWSQCFVMEVASYYEPETPDETYDIMNVLEDRLAHVNGAVVLAAVRVFLQVTAGMPETHDQVYNRIKTPLMTLATTAPTVRRFSFENKMKKYFIFEC